MTLAFWVAVGLTSIIPRLIDCFAMQRQSVVRKVEDRDWLSANAYCMDVGFVWFLYRHDFATRMFLSTALLRPCSLFSYI